MTIRTLLIANRGEIACRIARTARPLGILPVGIHSEPDAEARHVREIGRSVLIGPGPAAESYLKRDAVIEAALRVGADAIHPGYGFLSENPDFARAVEGAGLIFVGPTAETLERFGDKASAKQAALAAGLPVIPGTEGAISDPQAIAAAVRRMGYPVLLKAIGGGGGRGQRLVESEATLASDIDGALREARSTFGSEGLLLEKFLPEMRHVEVQVAGDGTGHVVHLFARDCTLQRRHQKVIEEAPPWGLPRDLLDRMAADATLLGRSVKYRGLGTVEFLVDETGYYFLEVNPRLQVEHPVTEAITGLDLVALQLAIAQGHGLGLSQSDITCTGHAVEARLYAEDPANQFAPSTGQILGLSLPEGVRIDSGVDEGDGVSSFYDPMIAKLIVHAGDRDAALAGLARALDLSAVDGVQTNRDFLAALARHPDFARMHVHTRWIDAHLAALTAPPEDSRSRLWRAIAAVLYVMQSRTQGSADPWRNRDVFTGWRLGLSAHAATQPVTLARAGGPAHEVRVGPIRAGGQVTVHDGDGQALGLSLTEIAPGRWRATHDGESVIVTARLEGGRIELATEAARHAFNAAPPVALATGNAGIERILTSPLTGMIVKVLVAEGDAVAAGDTVAILESMKLEISIKATIAGLATNISVSADTMVERGQAIAEISPQDAEAT
jgi:3-methylcrotonyl-CoA carboxylase alpha subunit